jgi:hypothetical protein
MIKKLIIPILFSVPSISFAQDPSPYAAMIEPDVLKENLSIIASDALEGRHTGSRGQKMAAAFIANHFETLGLTPINKGSYYQPFNLHSYKQGEISIITAKARFDSRKDLVFDGHITSGGPKPTEIVYIGTGTDAELEQVDLNGKIALIIAPAISGMSWAPVVKKLKERGVYHLMYYATVPDEEYNMFLEETQGYIHEGLLTLEPAKSTFMQWYYVSKPVVESLFGNIDKLKAAAAKKNGLKKLKPAKATITTEINEEIVKTENVMGMLEGTDKKDEVVVMTAHYDHVGMMGTTGDRIYNGADDDGSGTVMVLQLATAFAKAKKDGHGPRRSILFMTVAAEELGLYGSEYYTDKDPVVPLANTVVDLNIDMIGRWDPEHAGKAPYVYVIGADKLSSELQEINVRNNEKYTMLEFDYTYNDEHHPTNLYQRSDHWNFAKHRVPIVFYFDGIHEDYHQASDEVGKIDFDVMAKRGQSVFYTAWEVANRDGRLKVDK